METQNPKGWYMKRSDKAPYSEKEDGAFVLVGGKENFWLGLI
jgi:hypothetical protein